MADRDPVDLSLDEAFEAIEVTRRRVEAGLARQARLLVRIAGAVPRGREVVVDAFDAHGVPAGDRDPRVVQLCDEVVEDLAVALRVSSGQVRDQVHTARLLVGPLARTLHAVEAGDISFAQARVLAEQAARMLTGPMGADPGADRTFTRACGVLQDQVLPYAGHQSVTQTRQHAARAVARIDRAGAEARRRRARRHCDVTARALDDGLAVIEAVLPVLDAQAVMARLDEQVRACITDGTITDLGLPADAGVGEVRAAIWTRMTGSTDQAADRPGRGGVDPDRWCPGRHRPPRPPRLAERSRGRRDVPPPDHRPPVRRPGRSGREHVPGHRLVAGVDHHPRPDLHLPQMFAHSHRLRYRPQCRLPRRRPNHRHEHPSVMSTPPQRENPLSGWRIENPSDPIPS